METLFGILAGMVTLIGAAIPVYFKWKKNHDQNSRQVNIASDSPKRADFVRRMRQRLPTNQTGAGSNVEEDAGNL